MRGLSVLDDLVGDALDQVRRDGEADADGTGLAAGAGGGGDRRVDADDLSGRVERRAARVAGVDGGIDLHGVGHDLRVVVVHHADRTVQRGDDAGGRRVVVAQRVADGHNRLADRERIRIGEFDRNQPVGGIIQLDDRQIGGGVGAGDLRGVHLAVRERDLDVLSTGDHVVVGHDVALLVDDRAGAGRRAVLQRGLDRDHRLGDLVRHGGPIHGLAIGDRRATVAGLAGVDVLQRAGRRHLDPAFGDRHVADAQAQRRADQGRHHGDDHAADRATAAVVRLLRAGTRHRREDRPLRVVRPVTVILRAVDRGHERIGRGVVRRGAALLLIGRTVVAVQERVAGQVRVAVVLRRHLLGRRGLRMLLHGRLRGGGAVGAVFRCGAIRRLRGRGRGRACRRRARCGFGRRRRRSRDCLRGLLGVRGLAAGGHGELVALHDLRGLVRLFVVRLFAGLRRLLVRPAAVILFSHCCSLVSFCSLCRYTSGGQPARLTAVSESLSMS